MKHLLLTTIAAVLLVGCATTQSPEPPSAKAPDISIYFAAGLGNIEAVNQYLAAGADVNAKDSAGGTALHGAVFRGSKEVAELLISNGVDVNAKDKYGRTPLHEAAYWDHKEIVELLITKGADVNAKRKGGETPLDQAKRHPETANLLRKHGGKTGEELKAEGYENETKPRIHAN
jgi:ankyrin repeat protein